MPSLRGRAKATELRLPPISPNDWRKYETKGKALAAREPDGKESSAYNEDMRHLSAFLSLHPYLKVPGVEWPLKI